MDTIEAIRKLCDFKPLAQSEAYAFINKYYLPRLDTLPTKRKIYIFPIMGEDFKKMADNTISLIEKKFKGDTLGKNSTVVLAPPTEEYISKKLKWDKTKLLNTIIIDDTQLRNKSAILKDISDWYMCISYPQYNSFTKCLVITECLENGDWCGTGRERTFSYIKTPGGWKLDH